MNRGVNHRGEGLLIIRPGALGDTLMLLPLLEALKGTLRVTVAARRPGLDVLRSQGISCADVEGAGWSALFSEDPQPGALPLDLNPRRVLAFLSDADGRVKRNLGVLFPGAKGRVFPGRPLEGASTHAALHLARCAAEAGLPVNPESCVARAGERPVLYAGRSRTPRAGLVVHPGSGGHRKNLPPEFWLAFMNRLAPATRKTVLLGPAEERLGAWFEERAQEGPFRVVSALEVKALLSLLGGAACCAGHDSGISHLAAMLGTPTLAVFRTSDPRVWRPLGPAVGVLEVGAEEGEEVVRRAVRAAEILVRTVSPG